MATCQWSVREREAEGEGEREREREREREAHIVCHLLVGVSPAATPPPRRDHDPTVVIWVSRLGRQEEHTTTAVDTQPHRQTHSCMYTYIRIILCICLHTRENAVSFF